MTVRTLAEAAADVLARSKAVAPSEPMHKSAANWADLGGSTLEDPAGGPVGANAAALVKGATPPGTPAPVGQEPMKKLAPQPQQAVNALVSPPAATPSGAFDTAGHPVANVSVNEAVSGDPAKQAARLYASSNKNLKVSSAPNYDKLDGHQGNKVHYVHHKDDEDGASGHVAFSHHEGKINVHGEYSGVTGPEVKPKKFTSVDAAVKHAHSIMPVAANVHEDEDLSDEEVISEEEVSELSEEELAEIREAKLAMVTEKMKQMGVQEDIDALFNGEELNEQFRAKAATIFEAAVIARAVSVVEELENDILEAAEESVNAIKQELEEQVDAYLNYMVQEWINENKVAIESGLKNEIMEDFVEGLKNLFAEHYIEVPEEKLDVVESMADEIDSLKAKLNEAINDNIELATAITEATKSDIINSVCEGLTATQAEKVKTLAEGVEFTTEGEYAEKVKIIRESYFTNNVDHTKVKQVAVSNPVALTEAAEPVQVTEVSPSMQKYINAIGRTLPR